MTRAKKYIEDKQIYFDEMIEKAELMANIWIANGFNPQETEQLDDTIYAKEWQDFINSKFYELYNKIVLRLSASGVKKPGEAFKMFVAAFKTNSFSYSQSFNRELFIVYFNDCLQKLTENKEFVFEYKPAVKSSQTIKFSDNQPPLELTPPPLPPRPHRINSDLDKARDTSSQNSNINSNGLKLAQAQPTLPPKSEENPRCLPDSENNFATSSQNVDSSNSTPKQEQQHPSAPPKSAEKQQSIKSHYDKAIDRLSQNGEIGNSITKVISRLREGQDNWWNPYWINSSTKLDAIVNAILNIKDNDFLKDHIANPKSELYKALNMQRLAPITFLGRLGFNHAKSLMAVEEEQRSISQMVQ